MQVNFQMQQQQGESSGGLEQVSSSSMSSDELRMFANFRKMMKPEVDVMVIRSVERVIVPVVEDLIRKVVKEEIQSAKDKVLTGKTGDGGDDIIMSTIRSLRLKFIDEISSTVLTGKEIRGEGGAAVRVALVDETTDDVVHNGPEASAVVEILVLEANSTSPMSTGDNGCNWSLEEFKSRIILDNDKKRPHFTKSQYVNFKEGTASLSDIKLAQDSTWTKNCHCRLGARIVGEFGGIRVKEALTNSFLVKDGRGNLYDKHYPPSPSDELWRLKHIGKDGAPCKSLNDKNIKTVQDFLFWRNIDPQRLEKVAKLSKATITHAQTCVIDDKRIYVFNPPSIESRMGVVLDAVGRTKGIIVDSHYVADNNLSKAQKVCQHKLLLSAFENREDFVRFIDEASLLSQFPHPSIEKGDTNLDTDPVAPEILAVSVGTNVHDPEEASTSSVCIAPHVFIDSGFHDSSDMRQPYYEPFVDCEPFFGPFGDNEALMSLISPNGSRFSETFRADASSWEQIGIGCSKWVKVVGCLLWVVRARKKVSCQADTRVSKRQKTC